MAPPIMPPGPKPTEERRTDGDVFMRPQPQVGGGAWYGGIQYNVSWATASRCLPWMQIAGDLSRPILPPFTRPFTEVKYI
ncbi:hypothetical protein DAI22_05g186700 [Oryza sativa Japonica Group]|nr:hypothetical protein DAI22_05g186700 [Oryza sativa Japonica Group]